MTRRSNGRSKNNGVQKEDNHEQRKTESKEAACARLVSQTPALARPDARFEYVDLQFGKQLESNVQSRPATRKRVVITMNTTLLPKLICDVPSYAALQRHMREALRAQHPEWIEPNGNSPTCDIYESRFAHLLSLSLAVERIHPRSRLMQ